MKDASNSDWSMAWYEQFNLIFFIWIIYLFQNLHEIYFDIYLFFLFFIFIIIIIYFSFMNMIRDLLFSTVFFFFIFVLLFYFCWCYHMYQIFLPGSVIKLIYQFKKNSLLIYFNIDELRRINILSHKLGWIILLWFFFWFYFFMFLLICFYVFILIFLSAFRAWYATHRVESRGPIILA